MKRHSRAQARQAAFSRSRPIAGEYDKSSAGWITPQSGEAASTQQGENITETYLHQIHRIIDIAKRHRTIDPQDALCRFFEGISEEQWLAIEGNPPTALSDLIT
jgi:hypothetical protein